MIKIQKATPVSSKLMGFANTGLAIRIINPIINPANMCFFSPNTLHSPFLRVQFYQRISCANVKLKVRIVKFISKENLFVNIYFMQILFLYKIFGLFKNPIIEPTNKEANGSGPKAHPNLSVRPARCPPMIGTAVAPIR